MLLKKSSWMNRVLLLTLCMAVVLSVLPVHAAAVGAVPVGIGEPTITLATDEAVKQYLLGNGGSRNRTFAASANDLRLLRKHVSPAGEMNYVYQQLYRDVPVYGKYAKLRLDKQRQPAYVDNGLALELGTASLATTPSIAEPQAVDTFVQHIEGLIGQAIDREAKIAGITAFYSDAALMLYPHNGEYHLAYQVTVTYLKPQPGSWVGFVDAANGTILDKYSKRPALSATHAALGRGNGYETNYDHRIHSYHDREGRINPEQPDRYYLLDVTRPMFRPDDDFDPGVIGTYVYEPATPEEEAEFGETFLLVWSETDKFNNPEALDAHVQVGEVYDFFLNQYGWNSFDGQGSTVTSVVYYAHVPDNAFWALGPNMIVYGVAKDWSCVSCSGDIVAHEFAHGVIDYTAGLEYRNQSGALNESFADIFASVFSKDGNPWLIGETTGFPIRNMAAPGAFGQPGHMDAYVLMEEDNGGVHVNSGIPNRAAYLMADRIATTMTGLDGREALGQIAFRALHYLTPIDEFREARDAFMLAARDYAQALSLDEAATIALMTAVSYAWAEVGLTSTDTALTIQQVRLPYDTALEPVIAQEEATVYIPVPAGYPVEDLRLDIVTSTGAWLVPEFPVFDDQGEAVIWLTDGKQIREWTLVLVAYPALHYSGTTFSEASSNDGKIGNVITVTLQGDVFTGANGDDFVQTNKIQVDPLPAGLTARAMRISESEIQLRLDGKAENHRARDSVGLTVTFAGDAFQSVVSNVHATEHIFGTPAQLAVAFNDPVPVNTGGGGGGGGGGGFVVLPPPASGDQEAELTDDGVVIRLQVEPRTDEEGQQRVAVVLDGQQLADGFDLLTAQPDKPQVLRIPLDAAADVYEVALPVSALRHGQKLAEGASLSIEAGDVTYEVPLAAFTAEQLDGDGIITVTIQRVGGETKQALINRAADMRMKLIGDAYDFEIATTQNGTSTELNRFDRSLTRTMTVEGPQTNHVAVVRFDPASGRFAFVPATIIQADGKITATFSRTSNSMYAVVGYAPIFQDVTDHWASRDIEQLALRQIVSGVTADAFQPNARVTRAQFATMLVNALDLRAPDAQSTFQDVQSSAWYAAPVAAGVEAGLFSGFADGTFRPNETISREQMAVMLTNAMKYAGLRGAAADSPEAVLARFTDREAISGWAAEAIAGAVQSGLLFGKTDGRFAPADPATRAEAASILMRLLNELEQ